MKLKTNTLVGILVKGKKQRKRALKLYEGNQSRNVQLFAFTQKDVLWEKNRIIGLHKRGGKWKQRHFQFPDVVYNRCYKKKFKALQKLENQLGKAKCFNKITRFNKLEIYQFLRRSRLKPFLPHTYTYTSERLQSYLKKYKSVFLKPVFGSKGNKVYRLTLQDSGEVHISTHTTYPTQICTLTDLPKKIKNLCRGRSYIIQQAIELKVLEDRIFDIRCLTQKNKEGKWSISSITSRVTYPQCYNTSMYESIHPTKEILETYLPKSQRRKLIQRVKKISKLAAKEVEQHYGLLGELSVDFGLDKYNKLWIIELNGKPQKTIYNDIENTKGNKKIYSNPLLTLSFLLKKELEMVKTLSASLIHKQQNPIRLNSE